MYYTYILLCRDGSLYTGIAADIDKRMKEHFTGSIRAAKYTRSHPPKALAAVWQSDDKSAASSLEYRIKQLPRIEKLRLIDSDDMNVFSGLVDRERYRREDISKFGKWDKFDADK